MRNVYPVTYKELLRFKREGTYPVTYAILDDRIHFEMAIENSIFVSQRFIISAEDELKEKAENYDGDIISLMITTDFSDNILYQYFPTEKMIDWIKSIKLYKTLKILEINPANNQEIGMLVKETDDAIYTYNDRGELYMQAEKVLK